MMEYFVASGQHPPLNECLARVSDCDVLICIVAHRYGWIPEDQQGDRKDRSIVWLECEQAVREGKEILVFVADERADWPANLRES
jgi:hypothetical protein